MKSERKGDSNKRNVVENRELERGEENTKQDADDYKGKGLQCLMFIWSIFLLSDSACFILGLPFPN